jgi:NAD(P)-dependent dehydrogenase (short-subunit alcohol dehydrogenase family)
MHLQSVAAECSSAYGSHVEVLPLDLCAPFTELHEAATKADTAFGGAGVDYLVHNAGADFWGTWVPDLADCSQYCLALACAACFGSSLSVHCSQDACCDFISAPMQVVG